MTWIWVLLRFIALWISLMGYVGFFRAICKVPVYISYLFSLALMGFAMYVAGLTGVLLPMAYAVFALGFLLLLIVILTRRLRKAFSRPILGMTNFLFIVWFGLAFASLINYRLIHYDNFSHWALVVKQMLITNVIPDANSVLIDFKNYPLGISTFLYYISAIVGRGDGVLLVGQGMLIFSSFYAMFGVIKDHKRFLLATLLGLACAIISYFNISIRVNNLLVDYLLPLLALAAIAGILESGNRYWLACLITVPIVGLLLVAKNTGVFFAIPVLLFLVFAGSRARYKRSFGYRLLTWFGFFVTVGAAFLTIILWNMHTSQVFANTSVKFQFDLQSLRTLDLQNLSALVTDKTPEQIQSIIDLFIKTVFSLDQLTTQGIIVINVLAFVAWLNARFGFGLRWKLLNVLILMDLLIGIYYVGILAFYIVGMPLEEAIRLAGFERYAASMLIFAIGCIGLATVRDVERSFYIQQGEMRDYHAFKTLQTKSIYQFSALLAFIMAVLLLVTDLSGMNALEVSYPETLPAQAETILGNRWSADDTRSYLLYAPDTDQQVSDDFLLYVGRYLLFDPNVSTTSDADDQLLVKVKQCDFFAIIQSDDAIKTWMQEQIGLPGDTGVYSVQDLFGKDSTIESTP